MRNREELMNSKLERRQFEQYSSIVPVDWPSHTTKEIDAGSYQRWINTCPGTSVSVTYGYRGEGPHDEFEEIAFKPHLALDDQAAVDRYRKCVLEKEYDRLGEQCPGMKLRLLSVSAVRIVNDTCVLIARRTVSDGVIAHALEMRDVRLMAGPVVYVLLNIVTLFDGEKELERWRGWFVTNICSRTQLEHRRFYGIAKPDYDFL